MAGFLYGITPAGIAALAAVALLVGLAALTATYIPSRRATKVDPTIALKYE